MENNLKSIIRSDDVKKSFIDVMGNEREGNAFISSVLIAVANSDALQKCTPLSVISSALRAATMRLSCDPTSGQAYIVPFKGGATLVIGYKGLIHMALRTGKYKYLNVGPVYQGEEVIEDRMTGMHSLGGARTGKEVIGYLLYFELNSGFKKSFYMSREDIHAHAKRYSKSYGREDSAWKTNPTDMEKKTLIRLGLGRWGYFEPHDAAMIAQTETEPEEYIDAELADAVDQAEQAEPEPDKPMYTPEEIMSQLGF